MLNQSRKIKIFLIVFGFLFVWILLLSPRPNGQQTTKVISNSRVNQSAIALEDQPNPEEMRVDVNKIDLSFSILVTGDVNLARSVNYQNSNLNDYKYPFEPLADFLKKADLTIVNLESPLVRNCPKTNEGMRFCGNLRNVEGLVEAGVDVASLANNHGRDYGKIGVLETKKVLSENNILPVEHGEVVFKTVKGNVIAVIGYDLVGHDVDEEKIKTDAKVLKHQLHRDAVE